MALEFDQHKQHSFEGIVAYESVVEDGENVVVVVVVVCGVCVCGDGVRYFKLL